MGFDWKKTLGTVAPALATALGGPLGGVATKVALDALGIDNAGGEDALASAVASGDPNVLVKLKQAENDFAIKMKELDVDIYAKDVEDRASARQLGIARGLVPQTLLSGIFVIGFVGVLWVLFGGETTIQAVMMQPAMYVLGILSAGIIQIMNYWFGSSAGSKEKTQELAKFNK